VSFVGSPLAPLTAPALAQARDCFTGIEVVGLGSQRKSVRTSTGRVLASGSCYFRARSHTELPDAPRPSSARSQPMSTINNPLIRPTHHPPGGTAG